MDTITSISFSSLLNGAMSFTTGLKTLPTEGNLAYEYNPLRNFRLNESIFQYKDKIFTSEELRKELGVSEEDWENLSSYSEWPPEWIPEGQDSPVLIAEKGELYDFETDQLNLDLNHPIDIQTQYSYDGSVNLILNDGINQPRLINTRFSPIGKNKYQIVDRAGDNDTNIYDQGDQFDIDTSLYKRVTTIPELQFSGISYSGNLPIGNYHFYFKYEDADGNQTDYIAESGLVSIFIGNEPYNIYSGFREQNSYKGASFILQNLDPSYQYIAVYYTRCTSDIYQNSETIAYKVNQRFLINNANICNVLITGFEDTTQIDMSEINPNYQIVSDAFTQAQCQNMLFLGNVHKPNIPYTELQDLSLRFYPSISSEKYNLYDHLNYNYEVTDDNTYYSPKFIYDKVGYWPDEIYRLGIVYVLSDNTLSPVFNIRGIRLKDNQQFTDIPFKTETDRNYITFDETSFLITQDGKNVNPGELENAKGVIYIPQYDNNYLLSIQIKLQQSYKTDILNKLAELGIKGFFFVRQKRIPTTLCQAFTIGSDKHSHLPAIPVTEGSGNTNYIIETFLDSDQMLTHNLSKYSLTEDEVNLAAICPDFDINPQYYNQLFTGDSFVVRKIGDYYLQQDETNNRHFVIKSKESGDISLGKEINIVSIEDNVKLVSVEDTLFSARAGEAEEGYRYEYIGYDNKTTKATNLARGSYGPYLGFNKNISINHNIIDIKIPHYSEYNMSDYFQIRYQDKSSYYAISDRIKLSDDWDSVNCFRGDCYICQFTHRVNRNFSDPSSPTNDKIVDDKCWKDNYEIVDNVVDLDKFDNINLGDLNAVKMGLWVTVWVRSTNNLCIRAIDDSIVDETSLYGQCRAFYPYQDMRTEGNFKLPEAACYNQGFSIGLSERYNFELPDSPYIKNEFTNRILYSDIHVNDAYKNGYRVFQGTHYRDYPKTYGSITKLIEFNGNIICVFEHGIALIPVNERAVAGEGSGGNIYINTSNVLPENPRVISDTYGSQWRESIIKTPYGIYGVDTVSKKIWRTNGEEFECLSDFRVQEFLNQNISLTERETDPIVGIRNVKTHFNKLKNDVMFTFYDNLHGFEEKVWNLCYNELQQKWITFYSWVPSYSENIYNQLFSFDRNTSKWIAKLGVSRANNKFSDGIVLSNNVISNSALTNSLIGELSLANRTLPTGDNIQTSVSYELVRDNFGNYKKFGISRRGDKYYLYLKTDATDLCSELYIRGTKNDSTYTQIITDPVTQKSDWVSNCVLNNLYYPCRDDRGRLLQLSTDKQINSSSIVYLLNIKANIQVTYTNTQTSLEEAYATGFVNGTQVDAGYYQSVVAVIPQYNMQFLTTDFWKHGQSGIIDIADKVLPTNWYGKQHPFEFEFIVADNPQAHKIFNNLQIISNNAEPESFHYEIVGDCYDFADDKKNMYIRQEATKELYQYNGSDITYDSNYSSMESVHRPLMDSEGNQVKNLYEKSTLLPLYYSRQDTVNEIEDNYHLKDGSNTKDFSALSGGEIVYYKNLDEYRIWSHAKAVNLNSKGRLRGNMQYKEDKWDIQINPLNIVQKNEPEWTDLDYKPTSKIPVELGQSPVPEDILVDNGVPAAVDVPPSFESSETENGRGYVLWNWNDSQMKECKLKDKWIKIRVRYSGNKLAIITAIKTLYSISYA